MLGEWPGESDRQEPLFRAGRYAITIKVSVPRAHRLAVFETVMATKMPYFNIGNADARIYEINK